MHNLENYEAVVFDLDGVITLGEDEHGNFKWQKDVEADLGLTAADIARFFTSPAAKQFMVGQADLKQALKEFLPTTNATADVEAFVKYWLSKDMFIDANMVNFSNALRAKGIKTFIATNQERYRTAHFWDHHKMSENFDGMFASYQVGFQKPDAEFFKYVNSRLPVATNVLFLDDKAKNAEVSEVVGWQGYFFQGWDKFCNDFDVKSY